jgi:hypothetical protein
MHQSSGHIPHSFSTAPNVHMPSQPEPVEEERVSGLGSWISTHLLVSSIFILSLSTYLYFGFQEIFLKLLNTARIPIMQASMKPSVTLLDSSVLKWSNTTSSGASHMSIITELKSFLQSMEYVCLWLISVSLLLIAGSFLALAHSRKDNRIRYVSIGLLLASTLIIGLSAVDDLFETMVILMGSHATIALLVAIALISPVTSIVRSFLAPYYIKNSKSATN